MNLPQNFLHGCTFQLLVIFFSHNIFCRMYIDLVADKILQMALGLYLGEE